MSNPKATLIVNGFLKYIEKEGGIELLPEIVRLLQNKVKEVSANAKVTSSSVLTKNQSEKIIQILTSNFGAKEVEFEVDKDLIGGIKVKIGDSVIDLSLQNKLDYVNKSI
jgi:F-type H+-transporting ATPase subunit delta